MTLTGVLLHPNGYATTAPLWCCSEAKKRRTPFLAILGQARKTSKDCPFISTLDFGTFERPRSLSLNYGANVKPLGREGPGIPTTLGVRTIGGSWVQSII